MNTTAIVTEILIVGFLGALWMVLATLAAFGYRWVGPASDAVKGWEALLTVAFIAMVYAIGILLDRVADCAYVLLNPERVLMRYRWVQEKAHVAHGDARMSVVAREGRATEFLEHLRSRMRIARAAAFNTPLIAVAFLLFLTIRTKHTSGLVVLATLLFGALATLAFVLTLGVMQVTYSRRLHQIESYQENKGKQS